MSKVLKVTTISIGSVIGLAVLATAYVLFGVDPNDYKSEIAKVVKDKTDMDLVLSDSLKWQLWPRISLHLGKVSLSDGQAHKTLVAINSADVSVQVMPLLAKKIAIDEVLLDGAQLDFMQYANGSTSWDRMLNKLKSAPEEKSEKIDFNISVLNVNNSALHFRDEKSGLDGRLEHLLVQASNIDLKKVFPLHIKFDYAQTDGKGKTLAADNDLNTNIKWDQDKGIFNLQGLTARSHLTGTLLPAPIVLDLQGDITADTKQQQHVIDKLKLAVDYQDAKLKSPAHVDLAANIKANMQQQVVSIDGLTVAAKYPDPALKAPATVNLAAQINADLKQQVVTINQIKADASYPDATRPSPITAQMSGALTTNLTTGDLQFTPLDVQAQLSDKAFTKVMPFHLTAPIAANWKEGKVALNGFNIDALNILHSQGQIQAVLPALAATAKAGTPVTQGMTVNGAFNVAPFSLRQLLQTVGMTLPAMKESNTLQKVSLNTQITGTEQSVLLKGLKAQLDDSTLTGEVGVGNLATQQLIAHLALDSMNVDRYLPPADPKAKPAPSSEVLPVELLKKQNLDVALKVGSLTALNYPIKNLQLALVANGGLLQVKQLSGSIYDGSFSLPTTIDVRGKQPVLNVSPVVKQIEIAALAKQVTKQDLLAGKVSYQGQLQLTGNTIPAWMASISGNSNMKLENGLLHGANLTQLALSELGKYQGFLPAITGKDAATIVSKQNDTEIANIVGDAVLTNGTVQTKTLNADLRKAKLDGSGTFNLVSQNVDYQLQIKLDKTLVGDKVAAYPIPLRCKGNLSTPASLCSVDSRAVRDMTKTALLESEKAQQLKAKAEADIAKKQTELQQKLTDKMGGKMDADTQKAADKVTEQVGNKLNEQLQKLFKH